MEAIRISKEKCDSVQGQTFYSLLMTLFTFYSLPMTFSQYLLLLSRYLFIYTHSLLLLTR